MKKQERPKPKTYHPDKSKTGMVMMKANPHGEWVRLDTYHDLLSVHIEVINACQEKSLRIQELEKIISQK